MTAAPPPATKLPAPPRVPGWPLLGNAIALARQPALFWVDAAAKHGPAYRVRYPTAPNGELTVLAGLEANRLASERGHELFTTKEYYHRLVEETGTPNYICALDGDDHAHYRREMRGAFSRMALAPFMDEMISAISERAATWQAGQVVRVMDWVQRTTLDAFSIAASGCPISDPTYAALDRYATTFVGSSVAGQPAFLLKHPGYTRAKRAVERHLDDELKRHEAVPEAERRGDLMDTVLAGRTPGGAPFGHEDRIANAHLPYANGFIYGGRICAALLYALLRHPEVLERVRVEVDEAFAGGNPTVDTLVRMNTLRNAIRETYRRYPIAPAVPRYAAHGFDFAGHHVAQGSYVFVAIVVPHFDARYFADPRRFDPDRFAPPRSEHKRPFAYQPYGLGRHVCLSVGMVETVVMTAMAAILRNLDLEIAPPGYELQSERDPVPGPERAFAVRIVGRRAPRKPATPVLATSTELERLLRIDLPAEEEAEVARSIEPRSYAPGISIIRQGEPADRFFVIAEGVVEVIREQPGGEAVRVATLRAGDFFGEQGLLRGKPRNATVRAAGPSDVRVLAIDRPLFERIVADHDLTSAEIAAIARSRSAANAMLAAFSGVESSILAQVGANAETVHFPAGARVIEAGAEADRMYVITTGAAEVLSAGADPFVLARLGPGELFGEVGLLQKRRRVATVLAGPDGLSALAVDTAGFQKLIAHSATGDAGLADLVSRRLAELGQR